MKYYLIIPGINGYVVLSGTFSQLMSLGHKLSKANDLDIPSIRAFAELSGLKYKYCLPEWVDDYIPKGAKPGKSLLEADLIINCGSKKVIEIMEYFI